MRPRIFRNFGTKVLSIGLAALLWGLVAGQREAERSLRVPLEYRNIPPELELLGEPASLVDVRVRGSSGVLVRGVACFTCCRAISPCQSVSRSCWPRHRRCR